MRALLSKISHKIGDKILKYRKSKLKNSDFTIICNTCMGGVIYKRCGMKYLTPTIGLAINELDIIKFALNLKYYLNLPLVFQDNDKIVGKLDDVLIYFWHYKTKEEAENAWNRRKKRINFDNLYLIIRLYNDVSISQADINQLCLKYRNVAIINNKYKSKPFIKFGFNKNNEWRKDWKMNCLGIQCWEFKFNYFKFLNKK